MKNHKTKSVFIFLVGTTLFSIRYNKTDREDSQIFVNQPNPSSDARNEERWVIVKEDIPDIKAGKLFIDDISIMPLTK